MAVFIKNERIRSGQNGKVIQAIVNAAGHGPREAVKTIAKILKRKPKAILLIGSKVSQGVAMELVESKSNKWILNGWSIDGVGTGDSVGVGIAKDIVDTDLVAVDTGLYITRAITGFFDSTKIKTLPKVGFSVKWKF